jgi:hypothetical protein
MLTLFADEAAQFARRSNVDHVLVGSEGSDKIKQLGARYMMNVPDHLQKRPCHG